MRVISFHRTAADKCDAAKYGPGARKPSARILVLFLAIFCASLISARTQPDLAGELGSVSLALLLLWWWGPFRGIVGLRTPRLLALDLLPVQVQIDPHGICVVEPNYASRYSWRLISHVKISRKGLFIFVRSLPPYSDLFIPRRAFADRTEMAAVRQECLDYIKAEHTGTIELPHPGELIDTPKPRTWRTIAERGATLLLWLFLIFAPVFMSHRLLCMIQRRESQLDRARQMDHDRTKRTPASGMERNAVETPAPTGAPR
jgi:hypothetical protein